MTRIWWLAILMMGMAQLAVSQTNNNEMPRNADGTSFKAKMRVEHLTPKEIARHREAQAKLDAAQAEFYQLENEIRQAHGESAKQSAVCAPTKITSVELWGDEYALIETHEAQSCISW